MRKFVEEQRERERNGFYKEHRVKEQTFNYDNIERRVHTLSNLPAYQRESQELLDNGRDEYEKTRTKGESNDMAKLYIDSMWKEPQENVWDKAEKDPKIAQKLYLRSSMKRQGLGLDYGKQKYLFIFFKRLQM